MFRFVKVWESRTRVAKGQYGLILHDRLPVTANSAMLADLARLCHDYHVGNIVCVNTFRLQRRRSGLRVIVTRDETRPGLSGREGTYL